MRITFNKNIKTMSGKCNDGQMVFQSKKNDTVCIGRNYVYPLLTNQNTLSGNKLKAAAILWRNVTNSFKYDLQRYANAYNSQYHPRKKLRIGAYNVFIMAVCGLQNPIFDINVLSDMLGNTVANWISGGHLKNVKITVPFTATLID